MSTDRPEIAAALLDAGADINACSDRRMEGGQTALMMAADHGNSRLVRLLLSRGADMELRDVQGNTALTIAAEGGDQRIVQELIARGANVEARDNDGNSPLSLAAGIADPAIAQDLLRAGATVGLLEATMLNDLAQMQAYLEAGADRDLMSRCLWWAAGYGLIEALGLLLAYGADVDGRGSDESSRMTALAFAAQEGELGAIRVLLAHGANVDAPDKHGDTPLLSCVGCGVAPHLSVVTLLLDAGANINQTKQNSYPGAEGETALMEASASGYLECVRLLIERGADLEAVSAVAEVTMDEADYKETYKIGDHTALQRAVYLSRLEIVRLLLENGADPNNGGVFRRTPLSLARERTERLLIRWRKSKRYGSVINAEFGYWVKARVNHRVKRQPRRQRLQERRAQIVELLIAAGGTE